MQCLKKYLSQEGFGGKHIYYKNEKSVYMNLMSIYSIVLKRIRSLCRIHLLLTKTNTVYYKFIPLIVYVISRKHKTSSLNIVTSIIYKPISRNTIDLRQCEKENLEKNYNFKLYIFQFFTYLLFNFSSKTGQFSQLHDNHECKWNEKHNMKWIMNLKQTRRQMVKVDLKMFMH